jgi:hypothetical protein
MFQKLQGSGQHQVRHIRGVDGDLSVLSLPSPKLCPRFRFPGALRGEIPEKQVLPRIVALRHTEEATKSVMTLIDSLPERSRVAVEGDDFQFRPVRIRELLGYSRYTMFTHLAEYAQKKGHTVLRLESMAAYCLPDERTDKRRYDSLVLESLQFKPESPEWTRIYDEVKLIVARQDFGNMSILRSAWRSELMARRIALTTNWKESDLVVTGSAHAVNLAYLLKREVDLFIGEYKNLDSFRQEIFEVMAEQVWLNRKLMQRRLMQRRSFMILNPLKAFKNYS